MSVRKWFCLLDMSLTTLAKELLVEPTTTLLVWQHKETTAACRLTILWLILQSCLLQRVGCRGLSSRASILAL